MNEIIVNVLKEHNPKLGALIGAQNGELSALLTKEMPSLKIIAGDIAMREAFPDASFDFVFIDKNDYDEVKAAIENWYERVKVGGLIIGSAYSHKTKGVQIAVAEAFNLLHVVLLDGSIWMVKR